MLETVNSIYYFLFKLNSSTVEINKKSAHTLHLLYNQKYTIILVSHTDNQMW